MVSNGHQVVTTGPEEKYTYEISALGASFVCLKMKKNGISVIRDAVYFFRLFRLILAVKPDIVFSYTIKPNIYAAIAARIAGVKKIYPMVTGLGYIYTAKSLTAALLRPIAALPVQAFGFQALHKGVFFKTKGIFGNSSGWVIYRRINAFWSTVPV